MIIKKKGDKECKIQLQAIRSIVILLIKILSSVSVRCTFTATCGTCGPQWSCTR
jgi:hypothetical protein